MSDLNLIHGEALQKLKEIPAESVDAMVTDPPAGISFMGKAWDGDKGGRKQWISWMSELLTEASRVLKPGAHALVWALPRTSHWTATALEDAGFEIRDVVLHLFGSGFPKSLDVGKAMDKAVNAEREIVGKAENFGASKLEDGKNAFGDYEGKWNITAPATDSAKQWDGWGTALKPASEHWILARKPLSEPTVAANVLKWGTGGINIDKSRIGISHADSQAMKRVNTPNSGRMKSGGGLQGSKTFSRSNPTGALDTTKGRWPANVTLSHTKNCQLVGTYATKGYAINRFTDGAKPFGGGAGHPFESEHQKETVEVWACVPECAVRILDNQSGNLQSGFMKPGQSRKASKGKGGYHDGFPDEATEMGTHGDSGGASRFFYVAKPSRAERELGLDGIEIVLVECGA